MGPGLRSTPCQFLPVGEPQGQAWGSDPVNTVWCWDTQEAQPQSSRKGAAAQLGGAVDRPGRNELNQPTWVKDAGSRPIWIGLEAPPDHSTQLHWPTIAEAELTLDNI